MSLGNQLLNLRKSKHLSQEEAAEKLEVSRQTISKWETDQSTPDFDKIVPICELYGITPDQLLLGKENKHVDDSISNVGEDSTKLIKRAKGISIGILLYFVAIVWIMIAIPVFRINPIISSAIFLLICGIATYSIVYVCIVYRKSRKEKEQEEEDDKLRHQISEIVAIVTVIVYLAISFITRAWHITWIIWIIYALFDEVLKLIFMLRGIKNEK